MELITPDSLVQYVKPWGDSYRESVKYSSYHVCPNCERLQKVRGNRNWFAAVIGFSTYQPRRATGSIGILILECPYCLTKLWTHLPPESIWDCMCFCSRWPDKFKHPSLQGR